MTSFIRTSSEALTIFFILAILTRWPGTLQIRGPGDTGLIFDGVPQSSIHKRPLLFEGKPARGE